MLQWPGQFHRCQQVWWTVIRRELRNSVFPYLCRLGILPYSYSQTTLSAEPPSKDSKPALNNEERGWKRKSHASDCLGTCQGLCMSVQTHAVMWKRKGGKPVASKLLSLDVAKSLATKGIKLDIGSCGGSLGYIEGILQKLWITNKPDRQKSLWCLWLLQLVSSSRVTWWDTIKSMKWI